MDMEKKIIVKDIENLKKELKEKNVDKKRSRELVAGLICKNMFN